MPDEARVFSTPMMIQYMEIKKQYKDCILLFRLGDFYELLLDDALVGAKILGITLTARPRGKDGDIPMAGVPYHSADTYIAKLVAAGHKIAICEQTSQPDGKGIVEREVVRIITPGTVTDEASLDYKTHNYVLSLCYAQNELGLTFVELTTGELFVTSIAKEHIIQRLPAELTRFKPAEIIHDPKLSENISKIIYTSGANGVYGLEDWNSFVRDATKTLEKRFGLKSIKQLSIADSAAAIKSTAAALSYLDTTQKQLTGHISQIKSFSAADSVMLDPSTIANLEIFSTLRKADSKGSLIGVLDETETPMGARQLKHWLMHPLKDKIQIEDRHSAVAFLIKNSEQKNRIQALLQHVSDLERITSKLNLHQGTPKDILRLLSSLNVVSQIKAELHETTELLLKHHADAIPQEIESLSKSLSAHLKDEVPTNPKKGNFIQKGVNKELDALRKVIKKSQKWISDAQETERERTGIANLKIKFNKVFGYYIEISKSNLDQVPPDYERKQTLVNAERFITPDLKVHEDIILANQAKALELEVAIFEGLIDQIKQDTPKIQQAARAIASIDCLASLATVARKNNYTRPKMCADTRLILTESRHPVVEQMIGSSQFVPNDASFSNDLTMMIITGPNMAGKSVYMRQIALIVLMAHIGCFVPAKKAEISIVDRIFVRSGAADVISEGLSTFMVEMVETATILNHASKSSLVIMDEIGRGTTTYDGISIAWAVAEHMAKNIGAKSLFATHYHELQALEDEYPKKIKNFHAAVEKDKGEPVFIHRILEGPAEASYGIAVAKLAGVPKLVTQNAEAILESLETKEQPSLSGAPVTLEENCDVYQQLSMLEENEIITIEDAPPHPIIEKLQGINVGQTTPLEALNLLATMQEEINNSRTN